MHPAMLSSTRSVEHLLVERVIRNHASPGASDAMAHHDVWSNRPLLDGADASRTEHISSPHTFTQLLRTVLLRWSHVGMSALESFAHNGAVLAAAVTRVLAKCPEDAVHRVLETASEVKGWHRQLRAAVLHMITLPTVALAPEIETHSESSRMESASMAASAPAAVEATLRSWAADDKNPVWDGMDDHEARIRSAALSYSDTPTRRVVLSSAAPLLRVARTLGQR